MTQGVLDGNSVAEVRGMSKSSLKLDWERCLCDARNHQSTAVAAEVASSISWLKLWDMALDYSPRGTASLQALFRELTRPSFGSKPATLTICVSPTLIISILQLRLARTSLYTNSLRETGIYSCWLNTLNIEHCSCLVCVSVCLSVCLSVCPSVTALAASVFVYTCNQRYSEVSLRLFLDFDTWIFGKKPSVQKLWREKANMQMS